MLVVWQEKLEICSLKISWRMPSISLEDDEEDWGRAGPMCLAVAQLTARKAWICERVLERVDCSMHGTARQCTGDCACPRWEDGC